MGLGRSQNVEQRLPEEKRSRKKASYRSNGEHSLAFLCHMNTQTQADTHILLRKPKSCLAGRSIPGSVSVMCLEIQMATKATVCYDSWHTHTDLRVHSPTVNNVHTHARCE